MKLFAWILFISDCVKVIKTTSCPVQLTAALILMTGGQNTTTKLKLLKLMNVLSKAKASWILDGNINVANGFTYGSITPLMIKGSDSDVMADAMAYVGQRKDVHQVVERKRFIKLLASFEAGHDVKASKVAARITSVNGKLIYNVYSDIRTSGFCRNELVRRVYDD